MTAGPRMMHRCCGIAGLSFGLLAAGPALGREPPQGARAIVAATLIDGTGAPPVENAVIVIRDGRIVCVGSQPDCMPPPDAEVLDAAGSAPNCHTGSGEILHGNRQPRQRHGRQGRRPGAARRQAARGHPQHPEDSRRGAERAPARACRPGSVDGQDGRGRRATVDRAATGRGKEARARPPCRNAERHRCRGVACKVGFLEAGKLARRPRDPRRRPPRRHRQHRQDLARGQRRHRIRPRGGAVRAPQGAEERGPLPRSGIWRGKRAGRPAGSLPSSHRVWTVVHRRVRRLERRHVANPVMFLEELWLEEWLEDR